METECLTHLQFEDTRPSLEALVWFRGALAKETIVECSPNDQAARLGFAGPTPASPAVHDIAFSIQ